jgi:hypothetical protein
VFVEQPEMGKLLATKGGSIEVDVIASILNRKVPTCEEISEACANLYAIIQSLSEVRTSLHDEDWIESNLYGKILNAPIGACTGAQLREWRPQATVNTTSTTKIGFSTTSISRNTNVAGLGNLTLNNTLDGTTMDFISSREALSLLPAEQFTSATIPRKRKSDDFVTKRKPSQPKQATLETWITHSIQPPTPKTKLRSSGIVKDRRKSSGHISIPHPLDGSSSPSRGYDIDALPEVSFSSPDCSEIEEDDFCDRLSNRTKRSHINDIPTSPLTSRSLPINKVNLLPSSVAPKLAGQDKKSLGIRRGMKPWPSKRAF